MTDHAHKKHEVETTNVAFGFWIYLMSDCIVFACLFATYAVLHGSTFGGPTSRELFTLPFVLTETLILLTSSLTAGLAMLAARHHKVGQTLIFLTLTAALGVTFLGLEVSEFRHFIAEGASWKRSGFLSAFFTLVGTHGFHVALGLIWILVLWIQTLLRGLTENTLRKLICFSLFWHFLDIVWIFIFTFVYLLGAL